MKARVAALVGATAVGKTDVALDVARRLGAEVVSVDSMQVYRGMDVGTAKPTVAQRALVRHHLLDVLDPEEALSVARFQALARAAIAEVAARGRLPLLVGGSGLYFRAVVDDLRFPPHAPDVRRALEDEAARVGAAALHARLAGVDPDAAARIEPSNERRIVRALEVVEATGRPFSEESSWDRYDSLYDLDVAGLERPRAELYERIAARVDDMLERGLVDEARRLAVRGLGATARQALGYRQVLDAPEASPADLRDAIVRATKRFARRQESWFRADPRVVWFDARDPELAERLTRHFARRA
ncbi:MAG TPA: tRNA (adenosine(37)-N6)-dimethylallyltransferase MiaA [Actinomycetota bacterium]|nr:tRNA (adenosine(37)-N6)-dimethylallyltransferase MiaA [Actinomycetota bacterium]